MTGRGGAPEDWLQRCSSEQLHAFDAVQPHGILLALDPRTLEVLVASRNVARLAGGSLDAVLRGTLERCLDGPSCERVRRVAQRKERAASNPLGLVGPAANGERFDGVVHWVGDTFVLELESRGAGEEPTSIEALFEFVGSGVAAVRAASSDEDLYAEIAQHVRAFLGFERVMVYRFHPDGHGEVVAEDSHDGAALYHGLHFPEADIPAQARALYLRNKVRIIPRVDYDPEPLVSRHPRRGTGPLLDLSESTLRTVSEGHLDYLANMGVAASMSLSIVVDGELWGLVACHHSTPYFVPFARRAAALLLVDAAGPEIGMRRRVVPREQEAADARLLRRIARDVSRTESLAEHFDGVAIELLDLFDASGVVWVRPGVEEVYGAIPDGAASVARALADRPSPEAALALDRQTLDASLLPSCAGALISCIAPDHALVVFRPERRLELRWAADPARSVEKLEDGRVRLTPRGSAAVFVEEERGRCAPWTERDLELLREVRSVVVERLALDAERRVEELERIGRESELRRQLVEAIVADLKGELFEAVSDGLDPQRVEWSAVRSALERVQRRLAAVGESVLLEQDAETVDWAIAVPAAVELDLVVVSDAVAAHAERIAAIARSGGLRATDVVVRPHWRATRQSPEEWMQELTRVRPPDVLILGVDGVDDGPVDDAERVIAQRGATAIIVAATHLSSALRRRVLRAGAQEILDKLSIRAAWLARIVDQAVLRTALAERERETATHTAQRARELEEYAQVVSHDLKQPLAVMLLDLSRIRARVAEVEPESAADLGEVVQEIRRLATMINDLLEVARAEQFTDLQGDCALEALVHEALAEVRGELELIGGRVDVGRLPQVRGVAPLLLQVVRNLLSNAIRYRGIEPLRVVIDARRRGREWWIRFADNGSGVPSGMHESIFGLFQRASAAEEGSGIGLALCRRIVERHGGRIWSEELERGGACFTIAFPLKRSVQSARLRQASELDAEPRGEGV